MERAARPLTIYELSLTPLSAQHLQLTVTCSKGTYVRVLAEDIAKALGTVGHLTALRRIQTGDFEIANAITLADFAALDVAARLVRNQQQLPHQCGNCQNHPSALHRKSLS